MNDGYFALFLFLSDMEVENYRANLELNSFRVKERALELLFNINGFV